MKKRMIVRGTGLIHGSSLLENYVRRARLISWAIILFHILIFRLVYLIAMDTPMLTRWGIPLLLVYIAGTVFYALRWYLGQRDPTDGLDAEAVNQFLSTYSLKVYSIYNEVVERGGTEKRYSIKILYAKDLGKNAFAYLSRGIAVTIELLRFVNEEDHLAAMLAHEVGHHEARDILSTALIVMSSFGVFLLGTALTIGGVVLTAVELVNGVPLSEHAFQNREALAVGIVLLIYRLYAMKYALAYLHRVQEHTADLYASSLGYGKALGDILHLIVDNKRPDLITNQDRTPTTRLNKITKPLDSHPSVPARKALVKRFTSGDQGLIPDNWEGVLIGTTSVLVAGVLYAYYHNSQLPPIPLTGAIIWFNVMLNMLGLGLAPEPEKLYQKVWYYIKPVVGVAIGCFAIGLLGTNIVLLGLWILTIFLWIFGELGLDWSEPLSELTTIVLMFMVGGIVYSMIFV